MAILSGFLDGNAVPNDVLVSALVVDSVLQIQNNGPNVIIITMDGVATTVQPLNSRVFYLPKGTQVDWNAPASTASYQLAVPG